MTSAFTATKKSFLVDEALASKLQAAHDQDTGDATYFHLWLLYVLPIGHGVLLHVRI